MSSATPREHDKHPLEYLSLCDSELTIVIFLAGRLRTIAVNGTYKEWFDVCACARMRASNAPAPRPPPAPRVLRRCAAFPALGFAHTDFTLLSREGRAHGHASTHAGACCERAAASHV